MVRRNSRNRSVGQAALIRKKVLSDKVAGYKNTVEQLDPEVKLLPLAFWFSSRIM